MFIFYYAVLSEVSPPTALSPFAAAAITGGNPFITTLQSWKYTLPAFLLPFVFVLDPIGAGLLLKVPAGGGWWDVLEIFILAAIGIATLAFAAQGRIFRRNALVETALLLLAGFFLILPSVVDALTWAIMGAAIGYKPLIGGAIALAVTATQWATSHGDRALDPAQGG
jgi:TRAP-type uncharacterized transport system fused permease subunit